MPPGAIIPELVYPDLAGHRWTFSRSIADADPRDWGGELV
jgi:hypothetical protein